MPDRYRPVVGDQIRQSFFDEGTHLTVTAVGRDNLLAVNSTTGGEYKFSLEDPWEKVEIPKRYEVEMRVPKMGDRYLYCLPLCEPRMLTATYPLQACTRPVITKELN